MVIAQASGVAKCNNAAARAHLTRELEDADDR